MSTAHQDAPQGSSAIREAAFNALARYLDNFPTSMERDDLWEDNPLLLEWEATRALQVADELSRQVRDHVRYLAMIEH